jgi:hypothetical protein
MDPEVREAILATEQERGQQSPDGRDLSAELDKIRMRVDRINSECITEAR